MKSNSRLWLLAYHVLLVVSIGIFPLRIHGEIPSGEEPQTLGDLMALLTSGKEHPALYQFYQRHQIRVKFRDEHYVRMRQGKLTDLGDAESSLLTPALNHPALRHCLEDLERMGARFERLAGVSEEEIDAITARARDNGHNDLPDLNNYYLVRLPKTLTAGVAHRMLSGLEPIESVLLAPLPIQAPPQNAPLVPDYTDSMRRIADGVQWNLLRAPIGVNALFAWEGFRGDGSGVTVCDMEYTANFNHYEFDEIEVYRFPFAMPPISSGEPRGAHGTASLALIGARNDGVGVSGIAHGAKLAFVSEVNSLGESSRFGAITIAASRMETGDVLLLEAQTFGPNKPLLPDPFNLDLGYVAPSWDKAVYDAIRIAVASGITVVEAAGNGSQNMDLPPYFLNAPGWPLGEGPFQVEKDSGSIMVGNGNPSFPDGTFANMEWIRDSSSSHGATVDLFAQGASVTSAGYGDLFDTGGDNFFYTNTFGGTSSASAIVAGAVAVAHANYHLANDRHATPRELKGLLQTTGTAAVDNTQIGVMPDLRGAIRSLADPAVLDTPVPRADPLPGPYSGPLSVALLLPVGMSPDLNTSIRYTLDGTVPTMESFEYQPGTPGIPVGGNARIIAAVYRRDSDLQRWFRGVWAVFDYQQTQLRVATPSFSPPAGAVTQMPSGIPISIGTTTPGATITYRTDGNRFLLQWFGIGQTYSGPLMLPAGDYEIIAVASRPGYLRSPMSETFDIHRYDLGGTPTAQTVGHAPPPDIQPEDGAYHGAVEVTVVPPLLDSRVHYSLDGSDPTPESPILFSRLFFTDDVVVKAITVSADEQIAPSPVVSREYEIIDQAPPVTIEPNGGEHTGNVSVTMTTSDPGAVIRYTTNGSEPNNHSQAYGGPFRLNIGQYSVRAASFISGIPKSDVAEAEFRVFSANPSVVSRPRLIPNGGNHTEDVEVQIITDSDGAVIRYTLDQLRDVSATDPIYDPNRPLVLRAGPAGGGVPQIVRARAFQGGNASQQAQASFSVFNPVGTVEVPTLDPPGGLFNNSVSVRFDSPTSNAQFHYTTDGSDPRNSETARDRGASQPLSHAKAGILRVAGKRLGFHASEIAEGEFRFKVGAPEISIEVMEDGSAVVDMETITRSAGIRYTLDGSVPTADSERFRNSVTLAAGEQYIVQALATRSSFEDSEVSTRVVDLRPTVIPPLIVNQTESVSVLEGNPFSLAVEVQGDVTAAQWTKDGHPIAETGFELLIDSAHLNHSGIYQLTVSNDGGEVQSEPISVEVAEDPNRVDVLAEDDAVAVMAGESVVIDVLGNDQGENLSVLASRLEVANDGELEILEDGTIRYTAAATAEGPVSFEYKVGTTVSAIESIVSLDPVDRGFGTQVAMDGKTIAVSLRSNIINDPERSVVYIYRQDNRRAWNLEARVVSPVLVATEGDETDSFGRALAVKGDRVYVGAPSYQEDLESEERPEGGIYVYQRSEAGEWVQETLLTGADFEVRGLGKGFVLSGSRVLAMVRDDSNERDQSLVLKQTEGGWELESELVPPGTKAGTYGDAIALNGGWAAVGEPHKSFADGRRFGSAYMFAYDETSGEWSYQQELSEALEPGEEGYFGAALHFDGARLLVGRPQEGQGELEESGAVYEYELSAEGQWERSGKVLPPEARTDGHFGASLASTEELVLIGETFPFGVTERALQGPVVYQYCRLAGGLELVESILWEAIEGRSISSTPAPISLAADGPWAVLGTTKLVEGPARVVRFAETDTAQVVVEVEPPPLTPIEAFRNRFFETPLNDGVAADDVDPDMDGLSNIEEFYARTDPTMSESTLRIEAINIRVGGDVEISWNARSGVVYRISHSANLADWEFMGEEIRAEVDGVHTEVVSRDAGNSIGFYQLVIPIEE